MPSPLFPGRLMALANAYDALITERVYKAPFSHEKVIETIEAFSPVNP